MFPSFFLSPLIKRHNIIKQNIMNGTAILVARAFTEHLICNHMISWPPDNQPVIQEYFTLNYINLEEVLACDASRRFFNYLLICLGDGEVS